MAPDPALKQSQQATPTNAGPFVLRPLLQNVPLSAEGGNEDIKISCVDFLGMHLLFTTSTPPVAQLTETAQTATSMSGPQHPSCFTSSRYLLIPRIRREVPSSSSHQDCVRHTPKPRPHQAAPVQVFNKSSCCREWGKHVFCATGLSLSTRSPN